jgi:hypothetical protein
MENQNFSLNNNGSENKTSLPNDGTFNNVHTASNAYVEKTYLEKLAEDAFQKVNDELKLGINYNGKVKNVLCSNDNYNKISVVYEIDDNGIQKVVSDDYLFGGNFDSWNMEQLVSYIKKINGLYLGDINFKSYDTLVESLKFLIGADVTLAQYITKKNTRKNNVTVHGCFDRLNRKMVTNLC